MTTKTSTSEFRMTFNPAQAGALLAFLAVAFGAFGAHALSDMVTPARLATFETGVRYQMYHALGLLFLGALPARTRYAGWFLLTGSVIFSGSLYLLVLTDAGFFGAIAPIGGVLQLIGWGALFFSLSRQPATDPVRQ
jgi:uncharacterized membrane protein YgdD (TMEM256/DUF423 family)